MKKLTHITIITLIFISSTLNAQNAKRYLIEMSVTAKGKVFKLPLASASYSINRDLQENDSLYPATKKYIYYAIGPEKMTKDLLLMLKDSKTKSDILITMTDSFGKEPKRETLLKRALISGISESFSPFTYEYSSAINISIMAESMVIEGVEIEP